MKSITINYTNLITQNLQIKKLKTPKISIICYKNTIYIQTSAETVTEKYKFEDNEFKVNASSKTLVLST